jgi:hypothetical protein
MRIVCATGVKEITLGIATARHECLRNTDDANEK